MNPVAIITGGGTGIGAATAGTLRGLGWNVVICGRRIEPLRQVADRIGALPVEADATSAPDIDRLIQTTLETYGALDGLVLNAGIVRPGPVGTLGDKDWDDMVQTNLTGPFRMIRAAMPHLIEARGAIVGVSSAASLRATPEIAGYNASKAGLNMLIQSVAVDYGPQGIRANAVCPAGPAPRWPTWRWANTAKPLGLMPKLPIPAQPPSFRPGVPHTRPRYPR